MIDTALLRDYAREKVMLYASVTLTQATVMNMFDELDRLYAIEAAAREIHDNYNIFDEDGACYFCCRFGSHDDNCEWSKLLQALEVDGCTT